MNNDQYKQARILKDKIYGLNKELDLWVDNLTHKRKLGAEVTNDYFMSIDTKMNDDIFNGFRLSVIGDLTKQIQDLENEFNNL